MICSTATHLTLNMSIYIHTYIHTSTIHHTNPRLILIQISCSDAFLQLYTHTYTHVYTHIYTYIYIHTHIYIYTYIYTRIYTHTYTYIDLDENSLFYLSARGVNRQEARKLLMRGFSLDVISGPSSLVDKRTAARVRTSERAIRVSGSVSLIN